MNCKPFFRACTLLMVRVVSGRANHMLARISARTGAFAFCLSIVLLSASCGRHSSVVNTSRPNIILISIDTLRADHIHGYGYPRETTPVLDELMHGGTSFTNVITPAPWTLPAHVSLFTSLYPHSHGVIAEMLALNENVPTIPEMLKQAGYKTAGFATMPHLSPRHGFGRGFDVYVCQEVRAPIACERALNWVTEEGGENFFLFLHLFDVHSDYDPLRSYLEMFESDYSGTIDGTTETLYKVRRGEIKLTRQDVLHLIALYDAEIRQLDSALGTFFKALGQKGFLSNTVIIVTADHGEEFLEHGGVLHGQTLYDEILKIPLIINGPGVPAGKTVKKQVQLTDVMPTILELCGVSPPSGIQGHSVLPLIESENADWKEYAFAEADWKNQMRDSKRAVRTNDYKYYYDRYTKQEELYDIAADPSEQRNILQEKPDVADSLRKELRIWMGTKQGTPGSINLTEKEKDRLRTLGYLR